MFSHYFFYPYETLPNQKFTAAFHTPPAGGILQMNGLGFQPKR